MHQKRVYGVFPILLSFGIFFSFFSHKYVNTLVRDNQRERSIKGCTLNRYPT